jgi:exonuclease SbcC
LILEEIEVRDFRSHGHSRITLDQGITVIVGENGSGKTSLLEAVNFALFKQRPNNVDDLVRRGSKAARVMVKFHSGGRTYKVIRERKIGKSTSSTLYLVDDSGERIQAMGDAEVNKELEGVLGMGGDLFTSAVYIKQGEIDALISAEPAKRKAQIGKLIGAEDLEKAYQRMRDLVYQYDSKAREYNPIPTEIEKLEARLRDQGTRVGLLQEKLTEAGQHLEEKKSVLEKKEGEMRGIERYCSLEKEMKNKETELRSLLDKVALIEEYEGVRMAVEKGAERYVGLEEELKALGGELARIKELKGRETAIEKELENYQGRIKELDSGLRQLLEKYSLLLGCRAGSIEDLEKTLVTALEELEGKKDEARRKVETVSSRINEIKGRTLELRKAIEELTRAKGKCPVCSSRLTEEHKKELLGKYTTDLKRNAGDIEAYKEKLDELIKAEKNLESELQRLREINIDVLRAKQKQKAELEEGAGRFIKTLDDVRKATASLAGIKEKIASKDRAKAALQEEYNKYIEAMGYLRRNAPDKDSFLEESKALKKEIRGLEREVKGIAGEFDYIPDEARLEFVRKEVLELRGEVTKLEKEKSGIEHELLVRKENIEQAKVELEGLREKKLEGEKIARFVVFLGRVRSLFHKDSLQRELRVRAKPLIEKYTREIFDEFGLPYSDLALGDDFNLKLYSIAGEESADMLSGGERIASALALRLGISKALAGSATELIMLDEPTIHLDATRRRELVEIIKKLATIPQTIVVTHDREFESAADKLLQVKKTAGISQVVES